MRKLYLEGTKTMLLKDDRKVKFDYYLVEDCKKLGQQVLLYGIEIVKHLDDYFETENTEAISYSKDLVKDMVHKLWCNEVTLDSMIEIVDDLVSESV